VAWRLSAFASIGLRVRLATVVLVAIAPFVGVIAGIEYNRRETNKRDYVAEAGQIAEYAASQTAGLASGVGDTLRTIAGFPSIQDNNFDHCRRVFAGILAQLNRYTGLAVADADGNVLCSAPAAPMPGSFAHTQWFKQGFSTDGLLVGEITSGPISGLPTMIVSYGFKIPERNERLAVFAGVDLQWMADYLAAIPTRDGSRLLAFDQHGIPVLSESVKLAYDQPYLAWMRSIAQAEPEAPRAMQGPDGKEWAVATSRIGKHEHGGITLVVALDLIEMAALDRPRLWSLILTLIGAMTVTAMAVTLAARRLVVLPLRRVSSTAASVAQGNLGARVGEPYPGGELGDFMRSFDAMADKLRQHVRRIADDKREKTSLYRRMSDAVYRMEPGGGLKVTFISERASKLFDVAPETLLGPRDGWKGMEFIAPGLEQVNAMLRHATERSQPIDVTYRIRTGLGNSRWISERAEPLLGRDGAFLGYEGVLTDITDSKRAEHDLIARHRDLAQLYGQLLDAIAAMAEARDPYTAGHQRRVASLAAAIAREMGLPAHRVDGLVLAARIHDIGKIGVPADILTKPTHLTDTENAMVRQHVKIGYDVLKSIDFPWPIAQIVLQHHERLDGSGYPNGIKGDQMLPEARIMAVADVVESMASHRPYRAARDIGEVKAEMTRGRGTLYDAEAVDVALRFLEQGELHFNDALEALMPTTPPLDFGQARAMRDANAAAQKPEM